MALFRRKKNGAKKTKPSLAAEYKWRTYDYKDTAEQRDRLIKKLKRDGFDTRYQQITSGPNKGQWVIQTRMRKP